MTLYKAVVQFGSAHPLGASVTIERGERVEVDGVPYVRRSGDWLCPAHGWSNTEADAWLEASTEVIAHGRDLLERAEACRCKARTLREEAQPCTNT